MKKLSSIFWFEEGYLDEKGVIQTARVVLEIDYQSKNYSIKPFCGTIDGEFKFQKTSHKYRMWKALLHAIDQAIDFANKELGVEVDLLPQEPKDRGSFGHNY